MAALCCLLLAAAQAPAVPQTTQVMAVRDGIDAAVLAADGEALTGFGEQLAGLQGDWADYYRAYIDYRRSQLPDIDKKAAKQALNDCIDRLKDLLERRPELAEAHALQASCYGNSAAYYRLRAMARGSAANKALEQARELGADNPRVLLQDAQSLMYRPALFGGDKDKAMELLQLAAEGFPDWQSPDAEAPVRGEAETWLSIARLHREAGQEDQAREALEKALAVAPSYQAAKLELEGS
jgi:tetratricopeptide (TPR) repeat protein